MEKKFKKTYDMRERFMMLCLVLGAKNCKLIDEMYDMIERNYGDVAKHRFHHTLNHVKFMLDELDNLLFEDPTAVDDDYAVEMAIWFHDVIRESLGKDDEAKSAEVAEKFLTELGLMKWFVRNVVALIMATKDGQVLVTDDEKVIASLDFMIMAADEEEFERYDKNIALEYLPYYTREQYIAGRKKFMIATLDKTIFPSPVFAKHEEKAKANVRRIIAKLEQWII